MHAQLAAKEPATESQPTSEYSRSFWLFSLLKVTLPLTSTVCRGRGVVGGSQRQQY